MYIIATQLQQEYAVLQRLLPDHGPTAIACSFANIKILLLELSQKSADNLESFDAWARLNGESMAEFDHMLDFYGAGQTEQYNHSFMRLRYLIEKELAGADLFSMNAAAYW